MTVFKIAKSEEEAARLQAAGWKYEHGWPHWGSQLDAGREPTGLEKSEERSVRTAMEARP